MTLNTMSTLGVRKTSPDHIGAWLLPDITAEAWRDRAMCAKFPPQLWDPSNGNATVSDRARWEQAAEVCRTCPVIAECGNAADYRDAGTVRAAKVVNSKGELVTIESRIPSVRGLHMGKELAPCGSETAKKRHQKNKEQCDLCWPNGKVGLAKCGSRTAKQRHRRRSEMCDVCAVDYRVAA